MRNSIRQEKVDGIDTSISITSSGASGLYVVAITQTSGVGAVFDATDSGVECYMGIRGDGMEEAFARSLLQQLGCDRVLLTLSLRSVTRAVLKDLLLRVVSLGKNLV